MNSEIIKKYLRKGYCSYNYDIADLLIEYTQLTRYKADLSKKDKT